MTDRIRAPYVGVPLPDLKTSPIVADTGDAPDLPEGAALSEAPVCWFNGVAYENGRFVCTGADLLRCTNGVWVREGSCDPDHPD